MKSHCVKKGRITNRWHRETLLDETSYCCPCCPVPSVSFSTCAVHDVWTSEPYCLVNCPRQAPIGCQGCCISKGILRQWHIELEEHDLFSQPVINSHMQPSKSRIYNLHSLSLSLLICVVFISPRIIYACQYVCTKLSWHRLAMVGNGLKFEGTLYIEWMTKVLVGIRWNEAVRKRTILCKQATSASNCT